MQRKQRPWKKIETEFNLTDRLTFGKREEFVVSFRIVSKLYRTLNPEPG